MEISSSRGGNRFEGCRGTPRSFIYRDDKSTFSGHFCIQNAQLARNVHFVGEWYTKIICFHACGKFLTWHLTRRIFVLRTFLIVQELFLFNRWRQFLCKLVPFLSSLSIATCYTTQIKILYTTRLM